MPTQFHFARFDDLHEEEISLQISQLIRSDPVEGLAPAYSFHIIHKPTGEIAGGIILRVVDSDYVRLYAGHIGYGIEAPFRGRRYAARACRLLIPVAQHHGLHALWITCNPDNLASRRTCEIIGADFVETIPVPADSLLYLEGDHFKSRYIWNISPENF